MSRIPTLKHLRVMALALAVGITVPVLVMATFTPQAAPASAEDVQCSANGEAINAIDGGAGITFTITTTGLCTNAPMQLVAVDSVGNRVILTQRNLIADGTGKHSASVTFVPDHAHATSYEITIPSVFAATVTP